MGNAAAKASGINYRTAQRIVEAAGELTCFARFDAWTLDQGGRIACDQPSRTAPSNPAHSTVGSEVYTAN